MFVVSIEGDMEERKKEAEVEPPFAMREREVETGEGDTSRISFLVCEPLERAGFINAFSTRRGGVSPLPDGALNLTEFKGDQKEKVEENRRRFQKAIGAGKAPLVTARQTHSTERCVIEYADQARGPRPECDAMITGLPDMLLAIQTADCLPILIADTRSKVIAAIHAGWRGTANRITERTVADLMLLMGVNTYDCIVALGPTACARCYEVGTDVIEQFKKEFGYWRNLFSDFKEGGKAHSDICAANIQQLAFCGFDPENIYVAPYCTMHQNELFFSHRREGKTQPSGVGRLLSVIGRLSDRA